MAANEKLISVLNDLIAVDFDAIEAYQAAIERIADPTSKTKLAEFMGDHERHTRELSELVVAFGGTPVRSADIKRVLTQGKVVIADLGGDKRILQAMKSNEDTTNRKYEDAVQRDDLPPEVRSVVERNLDDERRHRSWIVARIDQI